MSAVIRPPQRHRYTVQDYYRMAETGILARDARVELIEGEIVDMTPIGSRHAGMVKRLSTVLREAVGSRAVVSVQDPVRLGDLTEPEPDIALLHPREDFYSGAHPTAADIYLIIEVSDSSLEYDRGTKLPLYARHGVPECWIVDLNTDTVSRHRDPGPAGYQRADVISGQVDLPGLGVSVKLGSEPN